MTIDPDLPIATIVVKDEPCGPEALAMGEAMVKYAESIGRRPWAMLSDLRDMAIATEEGQAQWIANMQMLIGFGLSRWAVLNRQTNAALQAMAVAQFAKILAITVVTFDPDEAYAWAASAATL